MTSDKDKELVPKGRVKDKVWQLTVFHRDLGDVVSRETICDAINALEPEPDYEAIIKEIEEYMCKEEYRLRTEGYVIVRGASRGENFLKKLKAKHTPVSRETDVREKPEEKDD